MVKKPRKRRYASDEAHAWARNLRLGNPYAKSILRALAQYTDEEGHCFVGIGAPGEGGLVDDCDLSPDTIRRRLVWLEAIGAIVRFPQWIDDHGRRNSEGRGKRTTDDIRLMLHVDLDEIEAKARDESASDGGMISPLQQPGLTESDSANAPELQDDQSASELSPLPQRGLKNPVSPLLAPAQPSHSCDHLNPLNLNLKESPQNPSCAETPTQIAAASEIEPRDNAAVPSTHPQSAAASAPQGLANGASEPHGADPDAEQRLARFKSIYPERSNRPEQLRSAFLAWSAEAQERMIRGAQGVAAARAKNPRKTIVDAAKFVRRPALWAEYESLAPPIPPPAPKRTKIAIDSDEYRAWRLACAIARFVPREVDGKVEIVGDVPNGAAAMAPLVMFNERGSVDTSDWMIAVKGSHEHAAWRDRVAEWTGRRVEDYRIWLDRDGNIVPSAEKAYREPYHALPRCKEGLLVPRTATGFPPRKNPQPGPPPGSLMTADDHEFLANGKL